MSRKHSRFGTLQIVLCAAAMLAASACSPTTAAQQAQGVAAPTGAASSPSAAGLPPAATPLSGAAAGSSCVPPAEASPAMTEGPYFKTGSPERSSLLEPATVGEVLHLSGYVLSTDCSPIAGAMLDFWQADGNGEYDNTGYGLRGHQLTGPTGAYDLKTVIPGQYPGRTEHIHVKVEWPGGDALTTQIFFPNVAGNEVDRIFDPRLVIHLQKNAEGWIGTYDFVVKSP